MDGPGVDKSPKIEVENSATERQTDPNIRGQNAVQAQSEPKRQGGCGLSGCWVMGDTLPAFFVYFIP